MKALLIVLILASSALAQMPDDNTVEFGPIVGRFEHPQYLQMVEDVDEGYVVGRLTWKGGKFEFEGNATAAAKAFLIELNRQGRDFCIQKEN